MGQSVNISIVYGWRLDFNADFDDEEAMNRDNEIQEQLDNGEIDGLDDFEPKLGIRDHISGYFEEFEDMVHVIGIEVTSSCPTRPERLINFFLNEHEYTDKLYQWLEECPMELRRYLLPSNLGFWVVATYG